MTETGGQPPVSFPVKDVAGLLFLLRRLTRRGINAACGQCPASGGHGAGAFYRSGWRR
ncbi:ycdA protein, partial [Escherichia coli DEC14B]